MESKGETSDPYAACDHIPKTKFVNEVDEELKPQDLAVDILPLYESEMYEHAFIKHYSFSRNGNLACRWAEYKNNYAKRVIVPYQLPDTNDLHFYNNTIRYRPDTSHDDPRYRMRPGPGVDRFGQVPISQDSIMKRDTPVKTVTVKPKKAGKEKGKINGKVLGDTK